MALNGFGTLIDIDSLGDVPVTVEVRIGCKPTTLEAVTRLDIGQIVALDRAAGETFDVYVGNLMLGTAEMVIVDNNLAIRITDLFLTADAAAAPAP